MSPPRPLALLLVLLAWAAAATTYSAQRALPVPPPERSAHAAHAVGTWRRRAPSAVVPAAPVITPRVAAISVGAQTPENAWMPLGAPPGAVPARAVTLQAPDLSRSGPNAFKRRPYFQGEASRMPYGSVASAAAVVGRRRPLGATVGRPLLRGGGAEEVVSAVVRVHPR